jgi:hypothetical protein
MTQVSGSISLELGKVVRETRDAVITELVRTVLTEDERENGIPVPLNKVSDAVAVPVLQAVMPALASIERKLDVLTELIRSESERRDRLANGPVTGEIPRITDEDLTRRGQGPAWTPKERDLVSGSPRAQEPSQEIGVDQ